MKIVYFASNNDYKFKELQALMRLPEERFKYYRLKIDELQNPDLHVIIRDKTIKAFQKLFRPVLVEHTGLFLQDYGNLPGGLTQLFWDALGPYGLNTFFSAKNSTPATVRTVIGFCDGKEIIIKEGEISGKIVFPPRGKGGFHWDKIFVPDGYTQTLAELEEEEKNKISMRSKAAKEMAVYLEHQFYV